MDIFQQLQNVVETSISKTTEGTETAGIALDVQFKYISGPIMHIEFLPGKITESVFRNFIERYKHVFEDKTEKFVFLFDLRKIDASSFNLEWIVEFIAVLITMREPTAKFVKGTAIYLPKDSDSIISVLQTFFRFYKTVRPHFASYKEEEILDFIEKCLFEL